MAKQAAGTTGAGHIYVGVGGWTFAPWRGGVFYPEGLAQKNELSFASRALTSIEINGTFYGSQKPESFVKWREESPDGFVFAVKGPRFATNRRVLAEAGESVARFFASGVMELQEKLGPINWQFAPTKKFDAADIAAFLALLPKTVDGAPVRHALEARHESFADPAFTALCREHGAAIVVAGDSAYPQIADATAPFVYARIMGTRPGEPCGYSRADIQAWAERAQVWAAGGTPADLRCVGKPAPAAPRDVFLYVISGHKEANPAAARAIIERLG